MKAKRCVMYKVCVASILMMLLFTLPFFLVSCNGPNDKEYNDADPDFSSLKDVATLATYQSIRHNVIAKTYLGYFKSDTFGSREVWWEYDAAVNYGVEFDKIKVSPPTGVIGKQTVEVEMPKAICLGTPEIKGDIIPVANVPGYFTFWDLNSNDQAALTSEATEKLVEKVNADENLKNLATERAKTIIEEFLINAGRAVDKEYAINFKIV